MAMTGLEKKRAALLKIDEAIEQTERVRELINLRLMKLRIEIAKKKAGSSS
jgi:hypothetical protein